MFPCGPDKRPLVPHGFKAATTDPATVRTWWGQWPDALIAVPTGEHTGIVVLDPDVRPGIDGNDTLYLLEERHGKLPPTVEALTPSGGRHIYFRHPGQPVPCSAGKLGPGLDVRGDGGYVVVPPSRNGAGGWEWEASNPSEPAELPVAWISLLVAPRHEEGPRRPEDTPIGEGQRNAHLTSLAGAMRRRGASADALRGALHAENEARCRPPLGAAEVDRIAASVHRYAPGEEAPGDAGGPGAIRIVDGELGRIVAESEAALLAAGGIYQRGGVPVHVRRVDDAQPAAGVARALGTPVIAACSPELLVLRLATDARFARYSGRRKKWEATNPPAYVGRFLVAKGEWTFPPLAGVVNAPTLRADG